MRFFRYDDSFHIKPDKPWPRTDTASKTTGKKESVVDYKLLGVMYGLSQKDMRNYIYLSILYIFGFGVMSIDNPTYGFCLAISVGVLGWLLEKNEKESLYE